MGEPVALDRLKKRPDFLRVAGLRRKWAAPGLILQAAPMPPAEAEQAGAPADAVRVGFTCSEPADAFRVGFTCSEPADAVRAGFTCSMPAGAVRVGFTCSKKVGNAVARNRARRRLKAAVDQVFPHSARPGLDYVVIGRKETVTRPYSLLLQDLRTALKRVGALRSEEQAPVEAPPREGRAT